MSDRPATPGQLLLSDRQAAAMAGVSRATWHRLRAAGKLPSAVRLGRCLRWRADELRAWIEAGCPPANVWQAMRAAAGRRAPRTEGGAA